jgi:hypothetical protein
LYNKHRGFYEVPFLPIGRNRWEARTRTSWTFPIEKCGFKLHKGELELVSCGQRSNPWAMDSLSLDDLFHELLVEIHDNHYKIHEIKEEKIGEDKEENDELLDGDIPEVIFDAWNGIDCIENNDN